MTTLFNEFEPVSFEEWKAKIQADLKGKPLSVLTSHPEPDLTVKAYHHPDEHTNKQDGSLFANEKDNRWNIRQQFDGSNCTNAQILDALNKGIDTLGIEIDENTNVEVLTKDILFEHISADFSFSDTKTALNTTTADNVRFNFDPIAINANQGEWTIPLADFKQFLNTVSQARLWVNGNIYGNSGASTVQELAFTIAHLQEYLQYLKDEGSSLEALENKIIISLTVNDNYFVNIAKFRVLRALIRMLYEGYGLENKLSMPLIYAQTGVRHLAVNDKNNNPLRQTTQAMSAVIGGCDVLTVTPKLSGNTNEDNRFLRIAKNIQLILKEEAYLDKVVDPANGAYYLENLSQEILTKSWQLFLKIEKEGGLKKSLENNLIQTEIRKNTAELIEGLNENKKTFLGVNKYPNGMEDWTTVEAPTDAKAVKFIPLTPFILEDYFIKKEAENE